MDKIGNIVKACLWFSLLVLFAIPCQAQTDNVTVEFYLTVPADTPPDTVVYLAGNLNQTGSWKPNDVAMKKLNDGRFYLKLDLPQNQTLQYKFTLGSWETVEKDQAGADISNRRLLLNESKTVNLTVKNWSDGAPGENIGNSLTGKFKYHEDFTSKILSNKRTIIVYLPPGYNDKTNADHPYPVLYMHDGQNIFDRATGFGGQEWKIDETADSLIKAGLIEPIIIVGIYNTRSRMTEYTVGAENPSKGRTGEDYTQFLVEELKPFIDKNYR
ncbi:MAG: esterase, partial [Planctomycetes bacterium]|nr:esterase [Planctomycetota bacterium]